MVNDVDLFLLNVYVLLQKDTFSEGGKCRKW